jgi:hypothetical protein
MQTKLTLRLDSELINNAKKIAFSRETSVSVMVSDFFRSLSSTYIPDTGNPTPLLNEISGILQCKQAETAQSRKQRPPLKGKYL